MITLNGTEYRLCLLDTNAVSEMVKRSDLLGRFLLWLFAERPAFIPCFSVFTILELRRRTDIYQQFVETFDSIPCVLLKSHEQLLAEEVSSYPDPTGISPCLLAFTGQDGSDLGAALRAAFETEAIAEQERYWNSGQEDIVDGIQSLVSNYMPSGSTYTSSEVRAFLEIAGFTQLAYRARDFASQLIDNEVAVDIDAFPSLKATTYTVFYKFYTDPLRKSSRSDAFDIIIAAATPYVDAILTENHQAEVLRKTQRRDDFIRDVRILTLRDV